MAFSPDNNHLIANYHYVENPRDDAKGIYPCAIDEFERHIIFLKDHYRFVSVPEIFEQAQKGSREKLCAITFDDGLQDQWENALPILKRHGVCATFFIITGTLEGVIPSAHKIHLLASLIPLSELAQKFNAFILHAFPMTALSYFIPSDRYLSNKRRHDDIITANFKEMLNNIAPRDMSGAFFSAMFKELGINEEDECKKIFMNIEQICALHNDGFFIETHTHNHYSLDRESSESIREDFRAAIDSFKRIVGRPPSVIAYPYGRALDDHTLLAEYGITHGVTVENRAIGIDDNALLIPRFDANDIKNALNITLSFQ